MLELDEDIEVTKIALIPPSELILTGHEISLARWSYMQGSLILKVVNVSVIVQETCQDKLDDENFVIENMFCAGDLKGSSASKGVLGSGALIHVNDKIMLMGVLSHEGGFFQDIRKSLPWIVRETSLMFVNSEHSDNN